MLLLLQIAQLHSFGPYRMPLLLLLLWQIHNLLLLLVPLLQAHFCIKDILLLLNAVLDMTLYRCHMMMMLLFRLLLCKTPQGRIFRPSSSWQLQLLAQQLNLLAKVKA
jgi:hypothetical protein